MHGLQQSLRRQTAGSQGQVRGPGCVRAMLRGDGLGNLTWSGIALVTPLKACEAGRLASYFGQHLQPVWEAEPLITPLNGLSVFWDPYFGRCYPGKPTKLKVHLRHTKFLNETHHPFRSSDHRTAMDPWFDKG